MYTQLFLDVRLKPETPKDVIETLKEMVSGTCEKWNNRLNWCFTSDSAYFSNDSFARFEKYQLLVLCNFKNYDGEIEQLVEWLKPHIYNRGMFGYTRYEEDYEPKILYAREKPEGDYY